MLLGLARVHACVHRFVHVCVCVCPGGSMFLFSPCSDSFSAIVGMEVVEVKCAVDEDGSPHWGQGGWLFPSH